MAVSRRFRVLAALVVALYALVAETSELRHHDLACSPKAPSQCETCLRGPEVLRVESGFRLGPPTLLDLGDAPRQFEAGPRRGRVIPQPGRAPPA
ncbi:MAG TPA: hypothetical protein VFQ51_18410 [Vicinamibacteria bacterium]|nr:hypothetical protein [Vicinamibacteria bacterium]